MIWELHNVGELPMELPKSQIRMELPNHQPRRRLLVVMPVNMWKCRPAMRGQGFRVPPIENALECHPAKNAVECRPAKNAEMQVSIARPPSYEKMDNFYTSTVYEKGAEVIRMYETLLGRLDATHPTNSVRCPTTVVYDCRDARAGRDSGRVSTFTLTGTTGRRSPATTFTER